MLTEVVTHGAAAFLGFASSVALILIERRWTKAINATRALTAFFMRNLKKLGAPESSINQDDLKRQVQSWLERPNGLGSEAHAATLVAMVQIVCEPTQSEMAEADRALNALDQRATERERAGS